jgi:hypothetical protein
MPTYSIVGPDGKTYSIDGPEGATRQQVIQAVKARMDSDPSIPAEPTVAPQEEAGFLENIGKGFASGAVSTGELASLGAAALLEEEDELAARAKIQEVAESLRPEGGDPDSYTYKIASGLGSIAGALAPAAAVTYGAPLLGAGATAATIGGLGTAGAIGVGAGAGEASERARAFGTTEEERNIATRRGALIGLSEILPFGKILKIPFLGDIIQKAGGESAGIVGSLRRALITGSGEAAQEAAAGIAQNYVERGYNLERELVDAGIAEEGLVGGASGAILELILDSGKAVRRGMRGQGGPERVDLEAETPPEPSEVETTAPILEDTVEPTVEAEEISPLEQQAIEAAERGDEATFENLLRRIELERDIEQAIEADDDAAFDRASQELAFEERRAEDPSIDERRKYGPPEGPLASPLERARVERDVAQEDKLRETDTRVAEAERARSEQRRMGILQQTIDETPTRNYNTLAKNFEQRLADAGLTNTQANQREAQIIERAVNVQRAERGDREAPAPTPAPLEQIEATPESTQLGAMEARVRGRPDSSQATLPGIKEPRKQQEAPTPVPEAPTPAAPIIMTAKRLDDLGIAPKSPLRNSVVGRDLNDRETRRRLTKFSRSKKLGSQQARTNVARLLDGISERQTDLFQPTTTTGRRPAAETGVRDARVAKPQQVPSGVSVPPAVPDVGAERAVPPIQPDTVTAVSPTGTGVGDVGRGVGEPVRGAVVEQPALKTKTPPAPAQAKKPTAPKQVTRKAKTPTAPAKEKAEVKAKPAPKKDVKKPAAKKPAPPKKPTLRDALDEETRKELEYQKEAEQLRAPRTYETPESDDPVTVSDIKKIAVIIKSARVRSRKATQVVAKEIKRYLATPERIIDGIAEAIYEDVTDAGNYKSPIELNKDGTAVRDENGKTIPLDSEATREYMQGHSAKNARIVLAWLKENGSKQLNDWIDGRRARVQALENRQVADIIRILKEQDKARGTSKRLSEKQIRQYVRGEIDETTAQIIERAREAEAVSKQAAEEKAAKEAADEAIADERARIIDIGDIEAFDDSLPLELRVGETYTDTILHPAAIAALKDGDLRGALAILATTPDKDVARIAKVFAEKIGDTKVEVASSRKIAENVVAFNVEESLAGSFDPKTNTIYLNPDLGISRHALLHEVAHALTSASLSNKSSPTTKQLNKLFDDVKDMLGTAYGTKNLDEFVAEAMSNPQFQADLAALNPNGSDVNALQRFLNSVGNFIRRLIGRDAKDIDSALTRADMLINEILAPAPEYRDANSLAMKSDAEGVKQVMNDVGKVQKTVGKPITKRERTSLARSTFDYLQRNVKDAGSAANAARRKALLALLDLQALGDVAGLYNEKVGLLASEILTTIKEMRGMMDNRANVVSREVAKVEKLLSRSVKNRITFTGTPKQKHLDELIYNPEYGATIYQVDPTKKRSEYEGKTDENGNSLAEVWDAQRTDWNALGKDGQEAYVTMRDMYKNLYNELKVVISERIDSTAGSNTALANKQKQEIFAKLFDTKALDVYFPLMREGEYKLSYTFKAGKAPKGEDLHGFLMFKSKAERDAIAKELRANSDIDAVDVFDGNFKVLKGQNAPSSTFMKEILQVVNASGADPVVQDQLVRMFIATLPESSFAKSLQRRTGVAGYDSNSVKAMKTKGFDLARQIERMRYLGRIQDLEGQLADKDIKAEEGQESQLNEIREELIMRTEFAKFGSDNKFEGVARTVNQIAFVYTIGANVASAMVQLAQVPMFTYPMLGAVYGYDNTQAEIMRASRIVMGAGMKSGETIGDRIAPAAGLDLYYDISDDATSIELKKDLKVPDKVLKDLERLKPLVLKAYRQGDLSRSFVLDSIGLKEGGRAYNVKSPLGAIQAGLDFGTGLSAMMFNQAERLNRQTTLVAAYQLELNRLNKEQPNLSKDVRENMAADAAIYNTLELNTGATLETAPRIAQQGLGRVAMMYKTYGLRMYYTMFKTAGKVLEDYRQARINSGVPKALANAATGVAARQMAGIHGSAVLFSGIHGIPLYGAVQLMFDNNLFYFRDMIRAIADLFEEEETLYPEQGDDFNTIVRNYLGEGWYKGGLNAALAEVGAGADVASRIRLTGLLVQQNRFNPDPSVEEFFGYYLGGPALSVTKRIGRGITDFQEGNFERAAEGILPAGISNMYKAVGRYNREGGIKTRRGDPIYDDMTSGELAAQFFGFAPAEYIRIQEENQNLKNIDRKTSEKRSELMKDYYLGMRMGTWDDMDEALLEILKFNKANPSFNIDYDSLQRSVLQHLRSSTKMHNGVQLSPRMMDAIEANRVGLEETFIPPK